MATWTQEPSPIFVLPATCLSRSTCDFYFRRHYDNLWSMRRAQALLVLIALLASPLALLARSEACADACTNSCCIALHHAAKGPAAGHCRGANQVPSTRCCDQPASNHALDYGFTILMPPSILPCVASIAAPVSARAALSANSLIIPSAFRPAPFEPPRA
jgi:hypothetical protein